MPTIPRAGTGTRQGRTKTGRLWTYVRDERPAGSGTPPSVWFAYSPDRKGIRPQTHLAGFQGTIHADGYAGFNRLFDGTRLEAGCWAHVRRKFYRYPSGAGQPLAATALDYIQALYRVEEQVQGKPPDERRQVRQAGRAGTGRAQAVASNDIGSVSRKSGTGKGHPLYAGSVAGIDPLQR